MLMKRSLGTCEQHSTFRKNIFGFTKLTVNKDNWNIVLKAVKGNIRDCTHSLHSYLFLSPSEDRYVFTTWVSRCYSLVFCDYLVSIGTVCVGGSQSLLWARKWWRGSRPRKNNLHPGRNVITTSLNQCFCTILSFFEDVNDDGNDDNDHPSGDDSSNNSRYNSLTRLAFIQ